MSSDPATRDIEYENERYFAGYSNPAIHTKQFLDKEKCQAYHKAIRLLQDVDFRGKTVLEVGCGYGLLAILAAKAGAKKVYAFEGNKQVAAKAELAVAANGLSDIVQVIAIPIEELDQQTGSETAPIPLVDVILADWMGHFLMHESVLESVLYARDRFLKPEGVVHPRYASLYMAPLCYPEFWAANTGFLSDVEGLDFGPLAHPARLQFTENPFTAIVIPHGLLISDAQTVRHIDARTITVEELARPLTVPFRFTVTSRADTSTLPEIPTLPIMTAWKQGDPLFFHAFVFWFDCAFTHPQAPNPLPLRYSIPFTSSSSSSSSSSSLSSDSSSSTPSTSTSPSSPSSSSTPSTSSSTTLSEPFSEDDSKTVFLSTRPGKRTHWEQGACFFPEVAPVQLGDSISGVFFMRRHHYWKRRYELQFSFRASVYDFEKSFFF